MMRKNAVVTGCSYGLGWEITLKLIEDGYHVHGLSRTKPHSPAAQLFPESFTWHECDITSSSQVTKTFNQIGDYVDVLVNNAGIFEVSTFMNSTIDAIDRIIDTNLKGTLYVTHQALKWMPAGSRIFFINSVSGLNDITCESLYGASKHALTGFAGVLGEELQKHKIHVTSIHPGSINTPMQHLNSNLDTSKIMDPSEISELISFICKTKDVEYKTIKLFPSSEWHK